MKNAVKKCEGRWYSRHWKSLVFVLVCLPVLVILSLLLVVLARALLVARPVSTLDHVFEGQATMVDKGDMYRRAERLAGAVRIPTVSYEPDKQEFDAFPRLHQYLETNYPLVHSASFIRREIINKYSLLYTVQGSVADTLPYLLMGHLDVVPADADKWDVPPFSGKIVNKTLIYGRGTLDDKVSVMAILEALEYILEKGERPKRTFYLAFGHDEELGGERGAQELAKALQSRGIKKFDFILDEGCPMVQGIYPGTEQPLGLIGVTEKGTTTLQLSVFGTARHASTPPRESVIGILSNALARLEETPQPSMFGNGPEASMLAQLAPHCSFGYRLLYSNLWLFKGLLAKEFEKDPFGNAMVRTTTAVTIFNSGVKENVVPRMASALVNLHVHPSQTVAQAVSVVRNTIADARVQITVRKGKIVREAHPVSPSGESDMAYQLVATSLKQVFPEVIVVPGNLIGNTDTRWYLSFSKNIYRLAPYILSAKDATTFHGANERIKVDNFQRSIDFYYRLIKNVDRTLGCGKEYEC